MRKLHITAAIILALFLCPASLHAGDLGGAANALEHLADMARSADNAQEALRDAMNGAPSRYGRHCYDGPCRYRDYHDTDNCCKYERRRAHYYHKLEKRRYKEWRKHHRHWD